MKGTALSRKREHLRAQELMRTDRISEALEIMVEAKENFGPHIGLLCDIACCLGLLGKHFEQRIAIAELEREFALVRDLVSLDSVIKTLLIMAKLKEDLACVSESLQVLNQAIREFDSIEQRKNDIADLSLLSQLRLQRLRLNSFLGIKTEIEHDYSLLSTRMEETDRLKVEVLHSLILAESALISPDFAFSHFTSLEAETTLSNLDRNLIVFDLAESYLRSGTEMPVDFLHCVQDAVTDDPFELTIKAWTLENEPANHSIDILAIENQINPMNRLRLISLAIVLSSNDEREDLIKKLNLHLAALDPGSEAHLRSCLAPATRNLKIMTVEIRDASLVCHGRELEVSPHSFLRKLLHLLADSKKVQLEEAVQNLYQEELTPDSLEKLRIAIRRSRQSLARLTGRADTVQMRKTGITLHDGIEITIARG